jgi:hypothetical protein
MTRREWTWRVVATEALFNGATCSTSADPTVRAPWSLLPLPPAVIQPGLTGSLGPDAADRRTSSPVSEVDASYVTSSGGCRSRA